MKTGFVQAACSHRQPVCDGDEPPNHTVPAKPVSPASMSWMGEGTPEGKGLMGSHLTRCLGVSSPVQVSSTERLSASWLFTGESYSTLLGLRSILHRDQRHHIPPLGLHHRSYKRHRSVKHASSSVPSCESEPSITTQSVLGVSLRSLGHCASSHPPRLGVVRRRILPQ